MKKILIIDDEELIREGLKMSLEMEGYEVMIASDGKEAFQKIQTFLPDVVVTDIIMPETDGIEVILYLRNIEPPPKIIAISGGGRISASDHLRMARKLGASVTLAKPFSGAELIECIENL